MMAHQYIKDIIMGMGNEPILDIRVLTDIVLLIDVVAVFILVMLANKLR